MNIYRKAIICGFLVLLFSILVTGTGMLSQADCANIVKGETGSTAQPSHSGLCRVTASPKAKIAKVLIHSKGVISKVLISPEATGKKLN